jgi:hypothetical protein
MNAKILELRLGPKRPRLSLFSPHKLMKDFALWTEKIGESYGSITLSGARCNGECASSASCWQSKSAIIVPLGRIGFLRSSKVSR